MQLNLTPKKEIENRILKFQKQMIEKDIKGALIIQKADLFYFSGTSQDAYLFIPSVGKPILMVKKSFERAKKESPVENILELKNLREVSSTILDFVESGSIGLEFDVVPASTYLKYQKTLNPLKIVDVSNIIRTVRAIKSPYELSLIKKAADINNKVFVNAPKFLKEGAKEIDVAIQLEAITRKEGSQGFVRVRKFNLELFYGHLMSGKSASIPGFFDGAMSGPGLNISFPQGAGENKIKKNEPIIVDFCSIYEGYMVDQTRMFSIGKIDDKLQRAFDISLNIKKEIMNSCKAGTNGKDMYNLAIDIADKAGLLDNFMGYKKTRAMFIAHGIGIELDELPVLAKDFDIELEENMVIALEPKFVFPNEGVVGIEDTFVVTQNGLEQITYFDDDIKVL